MKRSKSFYIKLAVVLLCLTALLACRFVYYSRAYCLAGATLCYRDRDKQEDVSVELEFKDWFTISRMFNFNRLEENWYRCPVSDWLCIKTGNQTFYIAGDGCDLVHIPGKDKCFHTGNRDKLWEILEKYGVER